MRARQVLADSRRAIDLASLAMDHETFRLHWAAAVALLRAVGHVLHKVDGLASPAIARASREWWERINRDRADNPLFWEFIQRERNTILREYAFGYAEDSVEMTSTAADGTTTNYPSVPFRMPMQEGPFKGQDGLDVAAKAAHWWDVQLAAVEAAAGTGAA